MSEHKTTDTEYFNSAYSKNALGDHEGAIADYDKGIKINPSQYAAYNNRGNAKSALGDHEGAIADYDKGIKINPDSDAAYNNLALSKNALGDHEGAIADCDEAIKIDPSQCAAYIIRAYAKNALGDHKGAIVDCDKGIKINPDSDAAYNNRGNAKNALGDHEGAIADCDKGIKINPDSDAAYIIRAYAKYSLSDLEGAMADFNQAIELNQDDPKAYRGRAVAKRELGDLKGALVDHGKAIELNPDNDATYFERANSKNALGDHKGAMADCDEAIRINPESMYAYNDRSVARKALGDYKGANEDLKKFKEIEINQEIKQKAKRGVVVKIEDALSKITADDTRMRELNDAFRKIEHPMGLVGDAAFKRYFDLSDGFVMLIKNKNLTCAAPLIRVHLDTVLRIFALSIAGDQDEFAKAMLGGEHIRRMKDKDGKKMTDKHLVQLLSKQYHWIGEVYEESSGYIHMSNKHIYLAIHPKNAGEGSTDNKLPDVVYLRAIDKFREITRPLLRRMHEWVLEKHNASKDKG